MNGTLVPLGYRAPGAETRLAKLMTYSNAMLIDIRFKPWSEQIAWRSDALLLKYGTFAAPGGKYRTLTAFGNVNYKDHMKPIRLANPQYGLQVVGSLLASGHTVILLCGCPHYEHCHRKTVTELIVAQYPQIRVLYEKEEEPA